MATTRSRRRPSRRTSVYAVGKPRGVLHPRVQQVGPEHFGIVCFDCAKARSKFLLADFYGRVLIPPTVVAHNRPDLDAAVAQIRQAFAIHQPRDGLVAIERTGRVAASSNAPSPPPASRRASFIPSSPSRFASPSIPATRPTTPTWPPSTAPPSPAARCSK